ncbi:alpha/beta fold hydrolase [Haloarchaeobius salinus]|uniref:alpha/beta fold hydrolase n=1 Tax=Haloarchaeobius salinus TaxID=1198298 RepID=UPI00210B56CC|nr:alpha/beta hydrolase [Haloarchaeobius salinus]
MDVPDGWTTDTVHANDVDLQYHRTGEGPPLVVAHGFYENARCRIPLVEDLAESFDVVAYDARGHGGSDGPDWGYGIDDRVADLVGLVEALELENPILFGHSAGGSTIAWAAARYPELPRAVVLEDPDAWRGEPDMTPEEMAEFVRERVAGLAEQSVAEIAAEHEELADERARRVAVANKELSPNVAGVYGTELEMTPDAFPDIAAPTLVLKRDTEPEERAEDLAIADALPDGRLVHIPDAGHHVFWDEYDAAWAELRAFLYGVAN